MQVVLAARYNAGQRGANVIELGDLLLGMVLEDNGMMGNLVSKMCGEQGPTSVLPLPSHTPFFPADAAGELLTRIENLLPQSEPIAHTIELPLSPDVGHVFVGAKDAQSMFHHKQIQPLHLLAAVLARDSGQHVKLLQEVGITKELVVERLRTTES
jgi:Clp amino terminal domain, pathogenicity island component